MSDDVAAEVAAPAEDIAPEAGQGEAEATPEPSYLDLDQYQGHMVRVKVDGEELEVPLSEAIGGYQRQADYTRKTQTLAEQQREAQFAITLQRALENNPEATIRLLQEQYARQAPDQGADDEYDTDPYAERFREYDQRIARYEEYQAQQELNTAIRVLRSKYGEDFDPPAVVSRAAQLGRMDLEGVYKEMAFEKMWTQQQAQQEFAKRRVDEDAARNAAKLQAGVLHTGNGSNPSATEPPTGSATSIAEAYATAKRQLGM